jgi:hypothetical protein
MGVVAFFQYLLAYEPTAQLATQLADVYTSRARFAEQRASISGAQR